MTFAIAPNDTVSIESNGFTISSILEYPIINNFSVFGTIGFSYLDVDRDVYLGSTGPGTNILSYSSSNSEGDILYGMGLRYKISDYLKIRIQWEHYNIDASDTIVSPNLETGIEADVFGVSLEYLF
ncbi:MAG: outer membrane beta-barrel protein [Deltaproteobacteria bacterium]|nr:outer membrane beta-barrel protein [Deltaproteobacteria bacterium]